MLASSMLVMQIEEGGALRACKLMVSRVLSGSSEIMRTVWSSHPTACGKSVRLVEYRRTAYQEWGALTTFRNLRHTQSENGASHSFAVLVFIQLAIQIQLEVNELCRAKSCHDLSFVRSRRDYCFPLRSAPFVDSGIRQHMPDSTGMNLQKSICPDLLNGKSRS